MTERVGFGAVSDTRARGLRAGKIGEVVGQEGNENTLVTERSTNTKERSEERQLRADTGFYENMRMQCT